MKQQKRITILCCLLIIVGLLWGARIPITQPVQAQDTGDRPGEDNQAIKVYLPIVTADGDLSQSASTSDIAQEIDASGLELEAREVRLQVPYGKDDTLFGVVRAGSTDKVVPASTPLVVRLLASQVPQINTAINLTLQLHAFEDLSGVQAEIQLPTGAEILRGTATGQFDLVANQRQELTITVVFRKLGEYTILGKALSEVSPEMTWGDQDALYFTVDSQKTQLGFASAATTIGRQAVYESSTTDNFALDSLASELSPDDVTSTDGVEESVQELLLASDRELNQPPTIAATEMVEEATVGAAATSATVNLSICWIFQDRAGNTQPIRDAYIQLWDKDSGADDLLASGYAGYYNGCYTFSVNNVDSDECCTIDPYVRIFTYHNGRYRVSTYGNAVYYTYSGTQNNVTGNYNFGTWRAPSSSGNDRSWLIYDDLYLARRFLLENAVNWGMGKDPGQVHEIWQSGGTDGTYYSRNDKRVHLADADAASRDTVVHEASHRYMDAIYSSWPPSDCPSPHVVSRSSGRYCAWTEGYTYVIVAGVDGNPVYTWPSGASLNLETPVCSSSSWDDGPTVEGRVGGLLIDLMDPFTISFGTVTGFSNEAKASGCSGADNVTGMFDAIWDLLYDQDDNLIVTQGGDTNSFSNAWETRQYPRQYPALAGDHNTINTFLSD